VEVADESGVITAAAFRDAAGIGRKVAIQILEFFDRLGYTRRLRDNHVVRRSNPWKNEAVVV
jgi:selenocysteine-specific elongation factor